MNLAGSIRILHTQPHDIGRNKSIFVAIMPLTNGTRTIPIRHKNHEDCRIGA